MFHFKRILLLIFYILKVKSLLQTNEFDYAFKANKN